LSAEKPFTATFSRAAAAGMRYAVVGIEWTPAPEHTARYYLVISTNCVHTSNHAARSLANLRRMLRPRDGVPALMDFIWGL
jgi:hypothetical protein